MKPSLIRPILAALTMLPMLAGCGSRPTTKIDAARAIKACGISPNEIAWKVTDDGAFAFGRKAQDATGPSDRQIDCLVHWATANRVKLGFIGWETTSDER